MTQRNKSAHKNLYCSWQRGLATKRFASTLPAQSLCWLSSFSLLSGGLVFAQTETSIDNIVPTIESSQSPAVTNTVKKNTAAVELDRPQPDFSERRARLKKRLRRESVSPSAESVRESRIQVKVFQPAMSSRVSRPQVETSYVAPSSVRETKLKTPHRTIPEKTPVVTQPTNNSHSTASTTAGKTQDYSNAYVDPTNYDNAPISNYQPPNTVILSERSRGCRTILSAGQGMAAGICAQVPRTSRLAHANGKSTPSWLSKSRNANLAEASQIRQTVTPVNRRSLYASRTGVSDVSNNSWRSSRIDVSDQVRSAYRPHRFIPNPSEFATTTVSTSPIAPSGGTLPPPMADGNVVPRPSNVSYDFSLASVLPQTSYTGTIAYRGGTGMIYPLSIPAPITSVFGWRVHPITGDRRFHAGTDLGAPMGTPVLAVAKGQVETADWVGGYGLAVILNHNSAQQTLYGHMSEIFVQPGQWVEPGTVIGRVGSTGNSTGPHLHFEVRHLTQEGWVAVDPGVQLQSTLSQLVQTLQTAQVTQEPGS